MNAHHDDNGAALVVYDPPVGVWAMRAFALSAAAGLLAIAGGVLWWLA